MKTRFPTYMGLGLAAMAFVAIFSAPRFADAGAGYFTATLPVVGGSSFCGSYVTGTGSLGGATGAGQGTIGQICAQTIPAGPAGLTGTELLPADIQSTSIIGGNTVSPTTAAVPTSLLGNSINRLIGSNADTNLNQRSATTKGIAALAGVSAGAAIITADRWWMIGKGTSNLTYTVDSTAATAVVPGLNNKKAFRIARTSGATGAQVCWGQTLDAAAAAPLIGQNAVFSFYESNGSTMSATNGAIVVNVDYTSAADTAGTQATLGYAGGNGSKFALGDTGQAGTPTNYTQAVLGTSPGFPTGVVTPQSSTVAYGYATIPASTTWTRYAVWAPIPVNVPGTTTPVTGVSVSVCFTPTVATSVTTDYIELEDLQLEAQPATVTASLPNGVTSPRPYVVRLAADEQLDQYYYWYFVYESQSLVTQVPFSSCTTTTSTTAGVCQVSYPVPMRITPVVKFTDGFQAFTSTAYTTLGALNTLAIYSNTLVTVASNAGMMFSMAASTLPAVGTANFLMQLGTSSATGIISVSAEP